MPDTTRLLTVADAAVRVCCHPETIRRAIRRGDLACYRMRGCTRIDPDHLQAYLDTSLCPASGTTIPTSSSGGAGGQSSGGRATAAAELRLEQRMNAALDKPSRTSRPSLNVVR